MRAVVCSTVGVLPRVTEMPDPSCPSDGVLVQVAATGVCRSDWHAWRGHDPVQLPIIPGHEFAGVIAAVGADVSGWQVGDRVTTPFVLGCGRCEFCRAGDAQVCPNQEQPGFTLPGSFAQLVAVPRAAANLVRLPDDVSFVAAASLGCRFATAFRALVNHGAVKAGQWVAVHGCGGVGLSAVMIAKAFGAKVVAVDVTADALAAAQRLGADEIVNSTEIDDVATEIVQRTGGGAHIGVDAVGNPVSAAASVASLRRRGRHVQVGLLLGADAHTAFPMDRVIAQELAIFGSHGMPAVDYPAMLDLLASGALQPERLVTRRIGLDDAPDALAGMDSFAGSGMTIIEP
ncbi:zinc-dependent alcohol dehydrogenase family protein [Mycolicibacterium smegmatis]|uniref:zinc-dependent alcohol dehydrogenase family protein n=1 Tax=Mycolicibacterium smegmatis TaxID=1772 RepID=UPI00071AF70D|nr:zinc-dependent alcohol dehydrogenase family protein [Mycolicibacterium smegmatis]MDF1900026.1 zinc-dependent alcohol dehydrogenase family protein [Mycolicibacterium smegmatis]MDF1906578.1 zinc-dependent alcohol dehydrogenase family protein [Mycolicibacterium smegmatis]MDF1919041.1 zinc-dependent alcohol dehydrogenase family protein [Mycolicibacterium smegmatis]MDF1924696.1 zinc-dependent alcohol dehydrogenase family protein [Mycolicibacterium smegmatis]UAK54161.1 zinc-dependent alcohol dehy